ncbi:SRPBCC domain-containing protein [Gryllotalpicola reticulitermitis]|uniref:SRPBCC domain-containing protein n=1 Tax=Gryllotalpicola reticulitermitis TaxID=1184153 RepID=A0ABV8QCT2_9MICO
MDTITTDAITREVTIDAAPETVWRILTEPEHIFRWWFAKAEFEPVAGTNGHILFRVGGRSYPTEIAVLAADAPSFLALRWCHPAGDAPTELNSTLVEFTLEPIGGQTLLRVVESGLSKVDWDADTKAAYLDSHTEGWKHHLRDLGQYMAWL